MFSSIEREVKKFSRHDPLTWNKWRSCFGLPGFLPRFDYQLLQNRQSKQIYDLLSKIFNDSNLRVSHDRWNIYLPTQVEELGTKKVSWKTKTNIHLDMNPSRYSHDEPKVLEIRDQLKFEDLYDFITENNLVVQSMGTAVQGLINLEDNTEEDGGLIIVPGFHKVYDEWLATMDKADFDEKKNSYQFPNDSEFLKLAQRIPMKSGSFVVWDQRCAHGSRPNESENFRMAQFIRMVPVKTLPNDYKKKRAQAVRVQLEENNFIDHVSI